MSNQNDVIKARAMDNKQLIEISMYQLTTVLSFFPRVDAKASVLLGINIGMLALMGSNAPSLKLMEGYMIFAAIPVILIVASLWELYQQAFPHLEGGSQSLIYFREIANRTEVNFIQEFSSQKVDAYLRDLLSQTWRNSEILKKKYNHLKLAFILTACASVPWAISLAIFAVKNSESRSLLVN